MGACTILRLSAFANPRCSEAPAEHTKSDLSSANSAILAVLTDKTGSDMANQRSIQNISSFQFQGSASQYYAISEDEVSQYGLSKYENIRSSF